MKFLIPIVLLVFTYSSCEKNDNDENESKKKSEIALDLSGSWINPQYSDSIVIYEKSSTLEENNYGFSFLNDGKFLERKNSGWCGTPPITYADYVGTWNVKDSIIYINVEYWGGRQVYEWKILSIDESLLKIYVVN